MPPLKVLIVHNDYQQAGGETGAVHAQIALLRERGHDVEVYTRDNAEIATFTLARRVAFVRDTLDSPKTYRDIRRLVEDRRPDVAHVHNVFPLISPSVYRALKDAGTPIVQGVHNYRFMCPNGLFYTHGQPCERCIHGNTVHAVRLRCYRDSYTLSALYASAIGWHRRAGTFALIDRFVVPAAFPGAKLGESGIASPERIKTLSYFLPDPLPRPGAFDRREPHVIYLGRLSDEKGLWTLIEAVRGLPEVPITIYGTGPLEKPIREHLDQHGVQNVRLGGFVTGEAKWDALRSALAVVVPSRWYDVSPFSVVESLTAGTAVIAPRHGSFPDAIADGETGWLFTPRDAADLRQTIARIAAEPDRALAMGRRARAVAAARYDAGAHYDRLMDIYRDLA